MSTQKTNYQNEMTRLTFKLFFTFLLYNFASGSNIQVTAGENLTISCPLDLLPCSIKKCFYIKIDVMKAGIGGNVKVYQYIKLKETDFVSINLNRINFDHRKGLVIQNIIVEDEGEYTCEISEKIDEDVIDEEIFSRNTKVNVLVAPILLSTYLTSPYVGEGQGVTDVGFCDYHLGRPSPTVRWVSGDGSALPQNFFLTRDVHTEQLSRKVLQMVPARQYNGQTIRCTIDHPLLETTSAILTLNVTYPPTPEEVTIIQRDDHLVCSSKGNPEPVLTWLLEDQGQYPTTIKNTSSVEIRSLSQKNFNYTCIATNMMGEAEKMISNFHLDQARTIRENANMVIAVLIGAVAVIIILAGVACSVGMRSTKQPPDSGWSDPLPITVGDTEDETFLFRPSPPRTKPPDDSETDSGGDLDFAFVRSNSILQDHRMYYQTSEHHPSFHYHTNYPANDLYSSCRSDQPSHVV